MNEQTFSENNKNIFWWTPNTERTDANIEKKEYNDVIAAKYLLLNEMLCKLREKENQWMLFTNYKFEDLANEMMY